MHSRPYSWNLHFVGGGGGRVDYCNQHGGQRESRAASASVGARRETRRACRVDVARCAPRHSFWQAGRSVRHLYLRFMCMSREGCVHIHFRTHHSRWLRSSGMSGITLSVCLSGSEVTGRALSRNSAVASRSPAPSRPSLPERRIRESVPFHDVDASRLPPEPRSYAKGGTRARACGVALGEIPLGHHPEGPFEVK